MGKNKQKSGTSALKMVAYLLTVTPLAGGYFKITPVNIKRVQLAGEEDCRLRRGRK